VHERSVENDFLLLALRRRLLAEQRQAKEAKGETRAGTSSQSGAGDGGDGALRIALMSATLDGDVLSSYFGGLGYEVPRVSFPGRAFPVDVMHLEEALHLTGHRIRRESDWSIESVAYGKRVALRPRTVSENGVDERSGSGSAEAYALETHALAPYPDRLREMSRRFPAASRAVTEALAALDPDELDVDLVVQLVLWYVRGGADERMAERAAGEAAGDAAPSVQGGSVLVFLSGTSEIEKVRLALLKTAEMAPNSPQAEWVVPLHGSLSPDDQKRAFERAPEGLTKVVLATNVAETSITIDDAVFVVDRLVLGLAVGVDVKNSIFFS
jgi:HrpA-like RNA helicase